MTALGVMAGVTLTAVVVLVTVAAVVAVQDWKRFMP